MYKLFNLTPLNKIMPSAKWDYDPYKGDVKDRFLYGCSPADNKASIVAML